MTHIEAFKKELAWATYKWLQIISTNKELKNKAISSFKNIVCIATYVILSNINYSNCFKWNLSKEKIVNSLYPMLSLKYVCVYYCLLLYHCAIIIIIHM